jgi:hypothetical protein
MYLRLNNALQYIQGAFCKKLTLYAERILLFGMLLIIAMLLFEEKTDALHYFVVTFQSTSNCCATFYFVIFPHNCHKIDFFKVKITFFVLLHN